MRLEFRYILWGSVGLLAAGLISWAVGFPMASGPLVLTSLVLLAIGFARQPGWSRHFAFTCWVFAFSIAALTYPSAFIEWNGVALSSFIVPLIQVIMFGMGCTLSPSDFGRVFRMPWPVLVGLILQFSIMPAAGLGLALLFGFDPKVAAGIVLIGACPGGVASNLMTYLARGNLALSVTMTACSTLASPLLTPWLMQVLAGQFIEIPFLTMFFSILNMIIVPIVAGLLAHQVLYGQQVWMQRLRTLVGMTIVSWMAAGLVVLFAPAWRTSGLTLGLVLIGLVAGVQATLKFGLKRWPNWMDHALPIVSMAGICYILAIMIAQSRDQLLGAGLPLLVAAILHNATGYALGYGGAKLTRLDESSCRTVALEVGLQNGGMATGLALNVLKSLPATLAPVVFGVWMNLSGSMLAAYWHGKPVSKGSHG